MLNTLLESLAGLGDFALYFAVSLGLLALAVGIYILITPHREMQLIRGGNTAAAVSLGGAVLGLTLPLASAVIHSVALWDLALWGIIALIAQILVFLGVRLILPRVSRDIEEGKLGEALFLAILSVATGILNAACLTS
jgi:putative membrane protein